MHTLPRITFEQDFGIAVDALGKNKVHFLVSGRKRGTVEHISDIDATLTLIGVCGGIGVVFHRVAGFGAHHGVVFPVTGGSDQRTIVDARFVHHDAELFGVFVGGLQVRDGKHRITAAGRSHVAGHLVDLVGAGRHKPIAVGVNGVPVNPVFLVFPQRIGVDFSGRHHKIAQLVVNVIAIHRQGFGEPIEVFQLLELRKRGGDNLRVEQTDVRHGRHIRCHRFFCCPLGPPIFLIGHLVFGETVGVARGFNIAGNIFGFLFRPVGLHREPFHHGRPCIPNHHRRQQHEHGGHGGNPQVFQYNNAEERYRHQRGNNHEDDLGR